MRSIGPEEVDRLLSFGHLVEVLREAFRKGAVQPVRHHHTIERAQGTSPTLLLMPAWDDFTKTETGYAGVKIVSVAPDNGQKALPAVMGVYLLLDGTTGTPLALIDGQRLTLWRTAAASALAASYLARDDASRLLVIGAGALAPFLARAHASVRPISEIRVWNRTPAKAEALADALSGEGFEARTTTDLDEALGWADIVSSATISPEPLVRGARLKPGTHVDLVGAFTPALRESDDEAVRRASVFVDVRESAVREAGDIVQAIESGALKPDAIEADLYGLTRAEHRGRASAEEITLFKSVGAAIEDLAAGVAVFEASGHQR
ncbi:ornithine cyclodeaminase family protein [Mesorhizobium sp. RP14(2022)]|uniref:Ornithine cyclodeaminase family protein n=1 Tax=Mesorhizobium liriopis TaxID=2953882 RepID=A0ABT1C3P9_9HYPH|nr:ornithine cyclodeaminase family protein [Mesorhizobium liriopis]MCO6049458.1 ornithine cyclodeaminase family protein [Mesorhizobium liriopis]